MRVIGYLEHPILKISVFKMDNRLSVKFENALYEQTFKFGGDDRIVSLEAVQQLVDEQFKAEVLDNLQALHRIRLAALARRFPQQEDQAFEEII
ncbi:MAG: hypothetical protein IT259_02475 [Saprospiraceae bacterium]|nr:hypothetical protein [Saprospiraceae bacterium]